MKGILKYSLSSVKMFSARGKYLNVFFKFMIYVTHFFKVKSVGNNPIRLSTK